MGCKTSKALVEVVVRPVALAPHDLTPSPLQGYGCMVCGVRVDADGVQGDLYYNKMPPPPKEPTGPKAYYRVLG